ncbi:hypothetical protein CBER1_07454 [Cercospora berteroae]|uniref:Uncharacterized protein n=1 Tax=Cercospora berteroae TaxID=357750 RepID=A0A2S6BTE9_9PEZI|nr:hypothetical protein CBER1_07454 [Cercospora berteroae]
MAEDISRPSADDRERRRGSLARRALQRVRAAMHRARDPGETTTERTATSDDEARNAIEAAIEPANTTRAGAESSDIPQNEIEQRHDTEPVEAPSIPFATLNSIEVDSSEEDAGESAMPARVGRSGLSREKARSLFAQNGFDYKLRTWRPLEEPPNKIRRVEKAIRLRVHYTCHECTRQFGLERTCIDCGHHRCRECLRNPPRKVRQVSDNAGRSTEDGRRSPVAGPSTAPPVAEPSRPQPDTQTGPLGPDDEYSNDDLPQDLDLAMYTRPRAAIQTVWKPQARPKQKHALGASSTSPDDEAPVVRAVQRVYRKPRQRVRYTCEQCDTLFVDHDQCRRCGHERCDGCLRQPPKRTAAAPDPEVVRSLEARLAAHGESSTAGAAEQS